MRSHNQQEREEEEGVEEVRECRRSKEEEKWLKNADSFSFFFSDMDSYKRKKNKEMHYWG